MKASDRGGTLKPAISASSLVSGVLRRGSTRAGRPGHRHRAAPVVQALSEMPASRWRPYGSDRPGPPAPSEPPAGRPGPTGVRRRPSRSRPLQAPSSLAAPVFDRLGDTGGQLLAQIGHTAPVRLGQDHIHDTETPRQIDAAQYEPTGVTQSLPAGR